MPRIPSYLAEVSVAAAPQSNLPDAAFGLQTVGKGLETLGASKLAYDQEQQKLLDEQQQRQGDLWLAKSVAELRSRSTQGLIDGQKTAPADGAGFTAAQLADYKKRYQEMAAGAPTTDAAQEFEIRALAIHDDVLTSATGFEAALHGQAVKTTFATTANQYAAVVRADPNQFAGSLADNLAAIDKLDLPADQRAELKASTGETLGLAYFNARIDANPSAARAELMATDGPALTLDPGKREQMLGAADVEIRRREAEARARAAEQRAIDGIYAKNRIEDEQAAAADGGTTGLVTDADWKLVYGDQGWQQAKANLAQTRGVAVAATDLALLPQSQWQAAIDAAAPAPQGEGYAGEAARRDFMSQAAQQLAKELVADPALYAVRHSPELAAAFRDAGNDPAKTQAAVALSLSWQAHREVPAAARRALTAPRATAMAQQIATADPPNMIGAIDGLAKSYGAEWPRVAGELVAAGLPAPAAALVTFDEDPIFRHELAAAIGIGEPTLKNALPKESITAIEDRLAEDLAPVLATMPAASAAPYVSALRLTALSFAQRMTPEAAADRAAAPMTGRYQVNGDYRVPQSYDAALVETGLDRYLEQLTAIDPGGGDPNLPAADRIASDLEAIRADHHWMTNSDESGVVLLDQNWMPVTRNGKPLELNFTLAEQLGKATPATAGMRNAPPVASAGDISSLGLTSQERFLYQFHLDNLAHLGTGGVRNADGTVSTLLQTAFPHEVGGKTVWSNIPTVWGGKIHNEDQAGEHAARVGWSKWPTYATEAEADARYQAMHRYFDADVRKLAP